MRFFVFVTVSLPGRSYPPSLLTFLLCGRHVCWKRVLLVMLRGCERLRSSSRPPAVFSSLCSKLPRIMHMRPPLREMDVLSVGTENRAPPPASFLATTNRILSLVQCMAYIFPAHPAAERHACPRSLPRPAVEIVFL